MRRKTLSLVLLRHGQSEYNKQNRFTGWTDVDLTGAGLQQARAAGKLLKERGYIFDEAHTSVLKRSIHTLWAVLDEMNLAWVPEYKTWRLNERCYGAAQGQNKSGLSQKYGEAKVLAWRKSFDARPPGLKTTDLRHPSHDPRYFDLPKNDVPSSESLHDVYARVLPYWKDTLVPSLKKNRRALVVASHHSLRSLVMILDCLSGEQVEALSIPLGVPLAYELDAKTLRVLHKQYLGDLEKIKAATEAVANQGKISK